MMTKAWKITVSAVVLLIVVVGGWWLWFSYSGSSEAVEAVANQFQPDSSWVLTAETIKPPRNVCLDAACNTVFKSWKTSHVISKSELAGVLKKSGWDFPIEDECDITQGGSGSGTTICEAKGQINDYSTVVTVIGARDHPNETRITLEIR